MTLSIILSTIGRNYDNVNLDECYQDYPAIIQQAGLNGLEKSEPVKPDEMPEPETKEKKQIRISIDGKTYVGTLTEENC